MGLFTLLTAGYQCDSVNRTCVSVIHLGERLMVMYVLLIDTPLKCCISFIISISKDLLLKLIYLLIVYGFLCTSNCTPCIPGT